MSDWEFEVSEASWEPCAAVRMKAAQRPEILVNFTIEDLNPSNKYVIAVIPVLSFKEDNSTAVFYGEAASRSVETISISSAPRDLNVANLGPLSVHISWSEPQEMAGDVQLIGYNVECKTGQICKHDTVSANQSIV